MAAGTGIELYLLADRPESIVETTKELSSLPGEYQSIKECKCCIEYDRTYINWSKDLPSGFKSPLDLFETTSSAYIARKLHHLPEIHIMSFGSGQLLRELIIIAM